ncbi:MAG: 50S ribosomal protein L25/general stress protein Ctc [Polaribacter sp.]|jgi:large subunit ribosomal protein L25|nr:50S ribosomal protein L25/general stress protein Ctc [Polaribacter sp.]MBT5099601.1 50S ribosomal protein L25/general stress protein Ctc [Polaribacter sp.]MBT5644924.1 50S ribosomal protein L25/general stress protein Ctc [Polaribacter sp.]MBT7704298.1 50S ribosomal protein L25/general stress protein Ctc [Polaribacter sp.]MDG1110526.1 50S ribosomal protein L25/general stress protein Ctc [Polaribacter sp.]
MKSITIKGSKRESVGKVATKALRNAGMVPCVIYGGEKPVHFSAEEKAFKKLVYTPDVFTASLDVDGQKTTAILQDIQFHPLSDRILHVDFYQLFDDKEVTMNIPVKLTGTSPGVLNGGSLRFTNRKLKIKALPANLPDYVTADISGLKIGSKLLVTSLFNDEYTFMHPDNTVVVQVRTSRNATATAEAEEEATEEATEAAAPAAE